ncbi:MAG: DUF3105 domain-containing protein [bacterium]|nr:DUF3105 domain-containing protein [bacterium]
MDIQIPDEWRQLPKKERREKIRELNRQKEDGSNSFKKIRNIAVAAGLIAVIVVGFVFLTRKTPEQAAFEKNVQNATLDGKIQEFPIEGADHVAAGTQVDYKTNPPTSGAHYAVSANWGIYDKEIADGAAVHGLEHGGIWISYKEIDDETKKILESIGKSNQGRVIVSPRAANDAKIAVASWGRMMKLETADTVLIQKYIDTYKNQGPEKLAQ